MRFIMIAISFRLQLWFGATVVDELDWRGEQSFYFSSKTVGRSTRRRERLPERLPSSRFNNGNLSQNDKSAESFSLNEPNWFQKFLLVVPNSIGCSY